MDQNMSEGNLLQSYLRDSLSILARSVNLARGEMPAFYRVAAVQLRLLLCDTTRRHGDIVNISLLPRLVPRVALHPLGERGFDHARAPIPLAEWLEQALPLVETNDHGEQEPLTVRRLIRRVCEQDGGAHVDPRPAVGLPEGEYREWVLRIAEEVLFTGDIHVK